MQVDAGWASEGLIEALRQLSAQQARGVVRIVQAELAGESLSSLLDCRDQICTSTTFYGSGERVGWNGKPQFQAALDLARRDYRRFVLEASTGEALVLLASTATDAVRALRQQIVGDRGALVVLEVALQAQEPGLRANAARRLGESGLAAAVPALQAVLQRERDLEVRGVIIEALGKILGFRDGDRRAAALGVLDRAGVETAAKQTLAVDVEGLDAAIEGELARVAGGGK